jgi:hypothetical protein
MIEPSQNTPPIGSYLSSVDFGAITSCGDLRARTPTDVITSNSTLWTDTELCITGDRAMNDRRQYIAGRLALADWIVMDDSYLQWYRQPALRPHMR